MNKFAVNIFPVLISILFILFSFSCSNELANGNLDYKKLEYHGYIFSEGKVSVFFKNYSNDNYLVTLNSLSPEDEINEKGITELIFLNSLYWACGAASLWYFWRFEILAIFAVLLVI